MSNFIILNEEISYEQLDNIDANINDINNWVDFDMAFKTHPKTKDIILKKSISSINQNIKNLLLLKKYSKAFYPNVYTRLHELLFENYTPLVEYDLKESIRNIIEAYEPRVTLNRIDVNFVESDYKLEINLSYRILSINIIVDYSFILKRER